MNMASVGMDSVVSVMRIDLVVVNVGDVVGVLSYMLGVEGVEVVHGSLVKNNCWFRGFSKDAAAPYKWWVSCIVRDEDRVTQDVFKGHIEIGLSKRIGRASTKGGTI